MNRFFVALVALLVAGGLGGCADRGHLGGALAPLFEGSFLDPEVSVRKPAKCTHIVSAYSYTRPNYSYSRYGSYLVPETVYEYDNMKECGTTYYVK